MTWSPALSPTRASACSANPPPIALLSPSPRPIWKERVAPQSPRNPLPWRKRLQRQRHLSRRRLRKRNRTCGVAFSIRAVISRRKGSARTCSTGRSPTRRPCMIGCTVVRLNLPTVKKENGVDHTNDGFV